MGAATLGAMCLCAPAARRMISCSLYGRTPPLTTQIEKDLAPEFGAVLRLMTTNGVVVSAADVQSGGVYVACGAEPFRRLSYGSVDGDAADAKTSLDAPVAPRDDMRVDAGRDDAVRGGPRREESSVKANAKSRILDSHFFRQPVLIL